MVLGKRKLSDTKVVQEKRELSNIRMVQGRIFNNRMVQGKRELSDIKKVQEKISDTRMLLNQ